MNSPTRHYEELILALDKARLITSGVNRLECNTDLQHLKLQSYILLCHAAFEQYLERLGQDAALSARKLFSEMGVISKTLVALISSKLIEDLGEKSRAKLSSDVVSNMEEFSKEACNQYLKVVRGNHGIVAKDQKKILIPVGVDPEVIDIVLMNNLARFGSKRGDVAHSFIVKRTDTLTSVETDLNAIVSSILAFDSAVCEALSCRLTSVT